MFSEYTCFNRVQEPVVHFKYGKLIGTKRLYENGKLTRHGREDKKALVDEAARVDGRDWLGNADQIAKLAAAGYSGAYPAGRCRLPNCLEVVVMGGGC